MVIAVFLGDCALCAEQIALPAAADTSLFEANPDNNLGGYTNLPAGATETGKRARGLMRFDVASTIPAGATIVSASLMVTVVRTPIAGGTSSQFELCRLLRGWGEGDKAGSSGGEPATLGEASWNVRQAPTNLWSQPGGAAPIDFTQVPSVTAAVDGPGDYTFDSTSNLVADVQSWLDHPDTNFGWILTSQAEDVAGTARRFASREASSGYPQLSIVYNPPTVVLRLTDVRLLGTNAVLTWSGGKPPYQVRMRPNLEAPWLSIGGSTTNTTLAVPARGAQGCYQVSYSATP